MSKVKFLRDFRSRDTNEAFYEAGQVAEFSDSATAGLLAEGVVVGVVTIKPVLAPVVEPDLPEMPAPAPVAAKKLGRPKKVKADG